MSDIEQAAKPTLERMIRGEGITLSAGQQEAIASWACLKTMVGAYAWGTNPIPRDWLDYFYREHLPPHGWNILTARYDGSMLQLFDSYRFGRETPPAIAAGARHKNILASLVVGHLAVSVRALRDEINLNIRTSLLPVWPRSRLDLRWPPGVITDATLTNFRKMGLEEGNPPLDPNNFFGPPS
jgi:hypothetical protein